MFEVTIGQWFIRSLSPCLTSGPRIYPPQYCLQCKERDKGMTLECLMNCSTPKRTTDRLFSLSSCLVEPCIGDYVRRGEESGWIKITLQDRNPDSKICITRKINKQNKSEWLLEGIFHRSHDRFRSLASIQHLWAQVNILCSKYDNYKLEFSPLQIIKLLMRLQRRKYRRLSLDLTLKSTTSLRFLSVSSTALPCFRQSGCNFFTVPKLDLFKRFAVFIFSCGLSSSFSLKIGCVNLRKWHLSNFWRKLKKQSGIRSCRDNMIHLSRRMTTWKNLRQWVSCEIMCNHRMEFQIFN